MRELGAESREQRAQGAESREQRQLAQAASTGNQHADGIEELSWSYLQHMEAAVVSHVQRGVKAVGGGQHVSVSKVLIATHARGLTRRDESEWSAVARSSAVARGMRQAGSGDRRERRAERVRLVRGLERPLRGLPWELAGEHARGIAHPDDVDV